MTENIVMWLPLSILWGNTLEEWVILAHNNISCIVGEGRKKYSFQRLNSAPCCLLVIQTTPPHAHLALVSALEPILVITTPEVAETVKIVIDEMAQ